MESAVADALLRAVSTLFLAASLAFAASDPSLARLQRQIEFGSHATGGIPGVSATHIESGRSVPVRGADASRWRASSSVYGTVQGLVHAPVG